MTSFSSPSIEKGRFTKILEQKMFPLTHQEKLILTFLNEGCVIAEAGRHFELSPFTISKMIKKLTKRYETMLD